MNELELSKYYLELQEEKFLESDIQKLTELLAYHSDLYYNKEAPIISDFEYDILFKKLDNLEKKFKLSEKQTKKVGSDIISSSFLKVKHSRPMISLDNTYNEEDLNDFDERVKKNIFTKSSKKVCYVAEFKFDGLGIELIYKNGELVQAITRGNGVEGEDVTENIKTIKNIPKKIDYKDTLEVRGEVVMPISSFEKLNQDFLKNEEKLFSNPRNAASGSVRLKDSSITSKRNLKFFAYDLANFEEFRIKEQKNNYYDVIKDLESFGFEISSFFKKCENIESIIKEIQNFGDTKKSIDFDIDGLVIKLDDITLWQEVGFTAHHPRYAIAYKFPAQILTTKILSVEHSIGRTGTITPVANLEPINIGGVVVKRATLHNYDEIKNLDARIGDNIFIKRAGEVIPKVISVIKETRNGSEIEINPPEFCPSCSTKVIKDEDKVRYYCPNFLECDAQVKGKLIYSIGKDGLDIDGFGKEQVELFYNLGFIKNLNDIFFLKDKKEEILTLEGYKEKSVNNLLTAIENAKNQNIVNFLVSLNISGIGKAGAKELSKIIKSKEDLINFHFLEEEIDSLKDVGEGTAKNIFEFFTNENNKILVKKLLENINLTFKEEITGGKYFSKKMCITGSFENYSREKLIEILEKNGGTFVSAVSKNTDFLLAGEKAGSKLKKAGELGVKVISLEEFLN